MIALVDCADFLDTIFFSNHRLEFVPGFQLILEIKGNHSLRILSNRQSKACEQRCSSQTGPWKINSDRYRDKSGEKYKNKKQQNPCT